MLEIAQLAKSFDSRLLWRDISFHVPAGTMCALTGPSGAGKSTLLHCIGRLQHPTAGRIVFQSADLLSLKGSDLRRFRRDTLGYLFQNYALVEDATVLENLKLAVPRGTPREKLTAVLAQLGLEDKLSAKVFTLSGGEQQRVALVRIIVRDAKLVLADEPTGALDEENAAAVVQGLRGLAERGATVIVATHNPIVRDACDQIITLSPGTMVTTTPSGAPEGIAHEFSGQPPPPRHAHTGDQ